MNRFPFLVLSVLLITLVIGTIVFLSGRASAHSYWLSDDDPEVCCDEHYVNCDAWELHPNPECHHAHVCDDSEIQCGSTGCFGCLWGCWPFSGLCDDYDMDGIRNNDEDETCMGAGCGYDPDPTDPNNPTLDLVAMGASSWVKDVFVEVDYLDAATHTHAPLEPAIREVVQAFANATVENVNYLYGTSVWGIQLHVDTGPLFGVGRIVDVPRNEDILPGAVGTYGDLRRLRDSSTGGEVTPLSNVDGGGDEIPEAGNEVLDWQAATGVASFYDLKDDYFNREYRARFFHYAIFGHAKQPRAPDLTDVRYPCVSGSSEGGCGSPTCNDFMVTLGAIEAAPSNAPCWAVDTNGNSVGNMNEQGGTFMHELGHNLGLRHGGGDDFNRKPHYFSVMRYGFQMCAVPQVDGLPGGCVYSRRACGTLDEYSLDECVGYDCGLADFADSGWDDDGSLEGDTCTPMSTNVSVDINGDGSFDRLPGFEDWNNLDYAFQAACTYDEGETGVGPGDDWHDEATQVESDRQFTSENQAAILTIEKTGPTSASPDDAINYNIAVKNTGRGPAFETVLTDTLPGGGIRTFTLGKLLAGDERTTSVAFTVPDTMTTSRLVNQASVDYEDHLAYEKDANDSFEINRPPVCDANGPYVAECGSEAQLDGDGSYDYDNDLIEYEWTGDFSGGTATVAKPSVIFSELGDFEVELTVSDGTDEVSCTADIEVVDTTPPVIKNLFATPDAISPPNHKMRPVIITVYATDMCDATPVCRIVSVTSDESDDGSGDGKTEPDWEITAGDLSADLRAERSGEGDGRVYTLTVECTDASENTSSGTVEVAVPLDQQRN